MSKQTNLIQKLTLATTTVLLVSSCATTPKANPAVQYQCDRGTELSVVFNHTYVSVVRGGRNSMHRVEKRITGVIVTLADGTQLELTPQRVTIGFSASNGKYTFSGKGNEAIWSVGKMAPEKCTTATLISIRS
jgi:membrane-bound inhibitor of C-type lysozyme